MGAQSKLRFEMKYFVLALSLVGVATYWPKVSDKIFDPVAAQYICGPDFIMECPEPTPEPPSKQTRNEWTCDDCLVDIDIFGIFYADPQVAGYIVEGLQGEDFCTDPDNGFPEDQIEQCAENMATFMPPALQEIGISIGANDVAICNAFYEGICVPSKKVPFF